MVQYNDELKQEIRNANDIVDVISQYVILKRSGKNFMGLCPFHKEKSPSFSVSPDRQYYHCFGCGKGGDVFNFVMEMEKLNFVESLEFLADRGHVKLPEVNDEEFNKKQYLLSRMNKINLEATNFFHERLYTPVAKIAQDYVKTRKLDNKTLTAFKIGYSGEHNELYLYLKSKGFKDNEITATGLVYKTDSGEFIDRFRRRLMFPIISATGKPVAFGGRRLNDTDKGKYINSNENLVYSKKKHLFALNLAKQSEDKRIILVEGYMDAISLYQRGFDNVVASLGTALTDEQAKLLRKYSQQVIFAYDSDGPGQTAIQRGIEVVEKQNCDARVLQIDEPNIKDPDEYVIKYGSGRFKILVDNAISLIEFKIKNIKAGYNLNNAKDKIAFLKKITSILSSVENKIEREIYIDQISEQYDISKQALYAEVNKALYKGEPEKILIKPTQQSEKNDTEYVDSETIKRENLVLYLLINYPKDTKEVIKSNVSIDDLKIDENKIIFEKIMNSNEIDSEKITQMIANIEDEKIQTHISEIMVIDYEITSVEKCIEDVVINYNKKRLQNRKMQIIKELEKSDLDKEKMSKLEIELNDIILQLAKIK